MQKQTITVETTVAAPVEQAWEAYTSPAHIQQWNFASDDWHCPAATVDLGEGGQFSWRMEARDGSVGFDFAGTYTTIQKPERIEYEFGGRYAIVTFTPRGADTHVSVSFDPESTHSPEDQRAGWQAILDNFARHAGTLKSAD